jgi:C1A family cysteine protease
MGVEYAPQAAALSVDASNWSSYKSGIFSQCGATANHAVLLVGVVNNSYWKLKNSWGNAWGENGYIRVAIGDTCRVCSYALYPIP